MKKLSVLFVALAVALSASAGIKLVQNGKVDAKDLKVKAMERVTNKVVRGGEAIQGTQLSAMDWQARPTIKANRDGDILWDFEEEAQLEDWTVVDSDGDGYSWEYFASESMKAHSGVGMVSSASYINQNEEQGITGGPLNPDNWLVSPKVSLANYLEFYAVGQDPSYAAEVFAVYVCVGDPENLENFVKIGTDQTASGVYKQFVFDLGEYAGQDGCIAIRHYNVSDMFRLNIDDVRLTATEPEPEVVDAPTVITEIPDGCQIYTYYRNSACIYNSWMGIGESATDGKFNVAFDTTTGDVYIQNPAWWHDGYNAWVKGTYDWMTGIITIPTGQFLSWSEDYEYGIQLGWGSTYVYQDVDEEGETGYYLGTELDEEATEIEFMIDDDYIYLLNSEGDINAEFPDNYNATGMYTYYSDDLSMTALEFANVDENGNILPIGQIVNVVPAVPADPVVEQDGSAWYDCGDESGFSKFYFTLPTTDVDGNMIDPEYLSYSIFTDDDQLFTFPAEDYTYDLTEDITEVPYWLYSSAVDFHDYYVYMYRTNEGDNPLFTKRIGIQVYYTVDSPESKVLVRNESNIIYYELPVTAIESVKAELDMNAPIYNIMGQKMKSGNLPAGVYIQNGKKFIVK